MNSCIGSLTASYSFLKMEKPLITANSLQEQNCTGCRTRLSSLKGWITHIWVLLGNALAHSMVFWVFYIIVSLCVFFLLLYVTEHEGKNYTLIQSYVLLAFVVVGVVVLLASLLKKSNKNFVQFGQLQNEHSNIYLMAGIYVFGTGTLMTILLHLLVYFHAKEMLISCRYDTIYSRPAQDVFQTGYHNNKTSNSTLDPIDLFGGFCYVSVFIYIARLLFTVLQLFFIQTFRAATFNTTVFSRFTLYHTIVTNACLWIHYLVKETHLFRNDKHAFSSLDGFVSNALGIEEIMTPFILEFSLLAAGVLQTISSHMEKLEDLKDNQPEMSKPGNSATTQSSPEKPDCVVPGTIHRNPDSDDPEKIVYLDDEIGKRGPGSSSKTKVAGSKPGLILGTFCGLLLVTSSFTFNSAHTKFSNRSYYLFVSYEGFLAFIHVVILCYILKALSSHKKSDHELCSEHCLLWTGYAGTFAFHFLTLCSIVKGMMNRSTDQDLGTLTIFHLIFLMISHIIQVGVIITSRNYSPDMQNKGTMVSAGKICQCALFLLTTNLGFWALDSFVEMKDHANSSYPSGKLAFKNDWETITAITYPFVVFFRFHSAEMLFEFWSRFNSVKEDL